MEYFKTLSGNISAFIARMTPSQVMMLLGVTVGTIAGAVLLVSWAKSVTYAPLYANLESEEAGDVVAYLTDNDIPFQITAAGSTIEIPSGDVYKTRIALATQGMPRSGNIGYAIFDKNNLGMTDFLQNLNFRRALEGELTRTIMQLREVKAARVHIVMPKQRLFNRDKKEATASIVLKLSRAGGLTSRQIAGITHLVASSVEGLKPSNIAIIDYDGNLLTNGRGVDELAGLSSTQLEVRKSVESYLQGKAQSLLDGVLGAGKSIVRVTTDLNFQQLERTSETFDPNAPSVRSEERTKSSTTVAQKSDEADENNEDNSNETTITNYELNKTVEHIINATGTIQRLSVALMVDGIYIETEGEDGETIQTYQPRPQEELDRLAAIVRNAVGFDPQRNDQIEVVNLAFERRNIGEDQKLLDQIYQRDFYMEIGRKVGLVFLALFAFMYFKKKSKRLFASLGTMLPPVAAPNPVAVGVVDAEREEAELMAMEPESRKPRLVDQMQKTAQDRPDEIAKVIRTMMIE